MSTRAKPAKADGLEQLLSGLRQNLVMHIFTFLDARDLCRMQATSRFFALVVTDEYLWK